MARYGSEAVARTTQFEHEYAPEQSTRTSFEVVPGGGLDADARRANNVIRNEMRATTATNDSLRVSRSLLASTTRIERIATQNYGMTLETNRPVVDVNNNA